MIKFVDKVFVYVCICIKLDLQKLESLKIILKSNYCAFFVIYLLITAKVIVTRETANISIIAILHSNKFVSYQKQAMHEDGYGCLFYLQKWPLKEVPEKRC